MPDSNISRLGSSAISVLFFGASAGALVVDSMLSAFTYALALAGIALISNARLRDKPGQSPADREIKLIGFAMAFFALTSLLSWSLNGFHYEGFKDLGKHGRLLLFWPLFVTLATVRLRATVPYLGMVVCAFLAGGVALVPLLLGDNSPIRVKGGTNPIPFGNLALLTGTMLLAFASPLWRKARPGPFLLTLTASAIAFSAAYYSGTRNNILAFPILLAFLILASKPHQRLLTAILGTLVLTLFITMESRMATGLDAIWNSFSQTGISEKGVQLRIEAWEQAFQLFLESPLIGSGSHGYAEAIRSGVTGDELPKGLLGCCQDHAHNDLLQVLATRGLLGALSWTLLLAIPFTQFLRLVRHESPGVAAMAKAGALVPLAYLMFGLTEATFMRGIYITFYLLCVTTLAHLTWQAVADNPHRTRTRRVSTILITFNEADNIGDCLASIQPVSDEIIVIDSGSTDDTVAIAQRYTDKITVTDWPGFGPQKQRALDKASGDWVLSIDADERLTPYLAREINHALAGKPGADAYKLPWAVTLYGKRLDFGRSGRAPLRLFRREGVRFSDALVHEKILLPSGRSTAIMRGRLTHYTHRDFGHALEKSAQYAWLGARERYRNGRKTRTLLYPTFRALLTFIQVYIMRLGVLDGPVGFLVAVTYTQGTFNKYAGLWTLTRCGSREDHRD